MSDDPYAPPPGDPRFAEPVPAPVAYQEAMVVRLTQVVWLLTGVLVGMIAIRFVLKLLAANPGAGFAQLVYSLTDIFMAPFAGLTATPSAGNVVFEVPAIVAMIVYSLLGWVIVRLLWILLRR